MNTQKYLKREDSEIYKLLGVGEHTILSEIDKIKCWYKQHKHLPEHPSDVIIRSFLVINKLDLDKTKHSLEMYYKIRTIIPDIYRTHPWEKDVEHNAKIWNVCPLPKLTPNLQRIVVSRFTNVEYSEHFDFNKVLANYVHNKERTLWEDISLGEIHVIDYKHIKKQYLEKISVKEVKDINVIEEEIWNYDIKEFHILNAPSFSNATLTMFKENLFKDVVEKFYVHETLEDLYKFVPKNLLPADLGGEEKPYNELLELWTEKEYTYKGRFEQLHKMVMDEPVH